MYIYIYIYICFTGIVIGERTPLVLFGIAHVKRVHMSATLSGLKLEAELQNAHASATHKEMIKGMRVLAHCHTCQHIVQLQAEIPFVIILDN